MMKAHIVYDIDGTENMYLEGHKISSKFWPNGSLMIKIYDAAGKKIKVVQFNKFYTAELDYLDAS